MPAADPKEEQMSASHQRTARTSPLHKWLAEEIRSRISSRELQPGEALQPELELCQAYDVSRGTVRQALAALSQEGLIERHPGRGSFIRKSLPPRKPDNSSPLTAQLGFSQRTFHIRVLVDVISPSSNNFVLNQTIEGLNLAAQKLGRTCKLSYEFHSFTQPDDPAGHAFLSENDCDGLMVVPYSKHCMTFLENLKQPAKPLATLYRHIRNDRIYRFAVDNDQGAYLASDYLLRLGHRRIGLLLTSHEAAMPSTIERHDGYLRAMHEAGAADDNLVAIANDMDNRAIRHAATQLLTQPDAPTALLVSGMGLMEPALAAIEECGLSIPDDLSVIGFDESEAAQAYSPTISIVRMPLVENGRRALEQLIEAITADHAPAADEVSMIPELVIRRSCRPMTPLSQLP